MESLRRKLQNLAGIVLLAAAVLAPLKFSSMLLPGVPHGAPGSVMDVVITALTPALFPAFAAILLALTVAGFGFPRALNWRTASGRMILIFWALPLTALLGFINPDGLESAVIELEYLLGVSSFATALAIILNVRGGEFKKKLLNAVAAGTLLTALAGVHQYFFGFDELRNFIETQEQVYGVKIPPELKARAYDVRVYATFTFASALAAFLLLTGGNAVLRAWAWGKNFEPANLSQKIFGILALLLCGGVLLATKGRGAFLAVIAATVFSGWLALKQRKLKLILALSAIAVVIAGACYIHYAGRGFGSMTERVGYLKSSLQMVIQHPFCGDGWGDFTYFHAQNKSFGNEELAKDPHNMAAAFASQCGIAGGLAVLLMMFYPVYRVIRKLKTAPSAESRVMLFALIAFALHAMMDLDWQVPALMMLYSAMIFIALFEDTPEKALAANSTLGTVVLSLLAAVTLAGGWHAWEYDKRFAVMKHAAGQEYGTKTQPAAAYEIDLLANKVVKIAPWSHSVYHAWGDDKLRRLDLTAALDLYRKALKTAPRSSALYSRLSEIALLQGDTAKAAEYKEKSDNLFPHKKRFFEQQKMKGK